MTPLEGYHLLKNPVEFVTATQDLPSHNNNDDSVDGPTSTTYLNGDEARGIYENIINEPSNSFARKSKTRKTKKVVKSKNTKFLKVTQKDQKPSLPTTHAAEDTLTQTYRSTTRSLSTYFKAAESGNLPEVKCFIEDGHGDIDVTDQFSWTALMMSSHNGHKQVTKYLLMKGAKWKNIFDGAGYDAYDLACLGGHSDVAHILQHANAIIKDEVIKFAYEVASMHVKREKLWCDICQANYSATVDGDEKLNNHHTSVLHQFCNREKEGVPSSSYFFLGSSNAGYKLLRKGGWDGESGLGPSGSGQKYPVKTVLKRNREGLGCESTTAKVTHFAPHDDSAVDKVRKLKPSKHKKLSKQREEKQKQFEMDFRRSFY